MARRGLRAEDLIQKVGPVGRKRIMKAILEHGGGGRDKPADGKSSASPAKTRPSRSGKYNAQQTEGPLPFGVGTRIYASKREADFADKLETLRKAGKVAFWLPQVRFPLDAPSGQTSRAYVCDFLVFSAAGRQLAQLEAIVGAEPREFYHVTVYDAKGKRLDDYKRKKRAMKQVYDIDIVEV